MKDVFRFPEMLSLGELSKIRVWHDNKGERKLIFALLNSWINIILIIWPKDVYFPVLSIIMSVSIGYMFYMNCRYLPFLHTAF